MKKKQVQELHLKTKDELVALERSLRQEISKLQIDMGQKKVKNTNELRTKMKERARLLTLAHAKTK